MSTFRIFFPGLFARQLMTFWHFLILEGVPKLCSTNYEASILKSRVWFFDLAVDC